MTTDTLQELPVNKTTVLYTPLEGNDVIVRTGTLPDGESFFHALLHGHSTEYVSMNTTGRKKLATRIRTAVSLEGVDRSRWEKMSNGLIARTPFHEYEKKTLEDFYRAAKHGGSGKTRSGRVVARSLLSTEENKNAFKLVTEMVTLDHFRDTIIPNSREKNSDGTVSEYSVIAEDFATRFYSDIFEPLRGDLSDDDISFYLDKCSQMVKAVCQEAITASFNEYTASLHDSDLSVTKRTIGIVSEIINRDIHFIDGTTLMPYIPYDDDEVIHCQPPVTGRRKSVVVLSVSRGHFEIIGKLLEGRRVKREFSASDNFIKRINTFLREPTMIPDRYPDLVPYLPAKIRHEQGMTASERGSDQGSSRCYSSDYEESDDE